MWFLEVTQPALVLGSTQAVPAGPGSCSGDLEVVRRRSGGGAVLLRPGAVVWADVFVPAGDVRWDRDVGRAFGWLGHVWAGALGALGVGEVAVHTGPLVRTPWSAAVCFAGLGPGEVTAGGRKVVGISQRRARSGALFQCAALLHWDALATADAVGVPPEALADVARGLGPVGPALETAFLDALSTR